MNNFLAITYAFMLAYSPSHNIGMGAKNAEYYEHETHVVMEVGLELFNCVNLYAGEETYQVPEQNIFNWCPYTQSYWLGAEYEARFNEKLNLKAGIRHKCQHPVECWQVQKSKYDNAYTELYVSVQGKVNLF